MQFGVAAAPDVGGVCPFWMAIYNRTTAVPVWGMLYESLDLTVSGDVHPFVFGTGAWNASSGFFNLFDSAVLYGGPTVVTTRRLSALSINGSAQPYPGAAQPLGPDGKWRAIRPPVNDSSGVWVGRCKNILAHPINRQYPTTYNVSTATPYVVLGQVLLPWATGVAPQSSP
jgi:hypothetical protein